MSEWRGRVDDEPVVVREPVGRLYQCPFPAKDKKAQFLHAAVWHKNGFLTFRNKDAGFDKFYFHTAWAQRPQLPLRQKTTTVPAVSIATLLESVLRLRPTDFVVVKMDVEGAEWSLLPFLATTPSRHAFTAAASVSGGNETGGHAGRASLLSLVDELFVECHHAEWVPAWPTQHSLADCHMMLNAVRRAGIFAHEWY